ncbi:hypothetical protein, partial [Klebsiella pneumoniae]|uniref:hypothetical protein n=1 Tax=Klebsiella pneumoniae TaxID=573 RepID=UPI003F8CA7B6
SHQTAIKTESEIVNQQFVSKEEKGKGDGEQSCRTGEVYKGQGKLSMLYLFFFFQAEDGIRVAGLSRGLGDV